MMTRVSVRQSLYRGQYLRPWDPVDASSFARCMRTDSRRSSLRCSWTTRSTPARKWLSSSRRDSAARRRSGWRSAPGCAAPRCRRVRCRSSRRRCVATAPACSARRPRRRWLRSTPSRGGRIRALDTTWSETLGSCSACRCATSAAPRRWSLCAANIPDFGTASTARWLPWQRPSVRGACTGGTWSNCVLGNITSSLW